MYDNYNEPQAEIARANHIMEKLSVAQERFTFHVGEYPDAAQASATLKAQDNSIAVRTLGHEAKARPRVVAHAKNFYMEYAFKVDHDGEQVEVARLYLDQDGEFRQSLDQEARTFASRNLYVAVQICTIVGIGLLESRVFAPA